DAIAAWDEYGVDQTVLFGAISSPLARVTDVMAFEMFRENPDRVYPFFAGVSIYGDDGLEILRGDLEAGYFGIGEIVGASSHSPETRDLPWKGDHPNDGLFPELYRLSAEYGVPVLVHIDPPFGYPIDRLEDALDENPDAIIIFAHANAYNPPDNIARLMRAHPNLYFDFFAGFTAYNPGSSNTLADFVPLIEEFPGRTFVSTDSGYGVGYGLAVTAIYELFDLLSPETVCRIASENIDAIFQAQPPTATQLARLAELAPDTDTSDLNKMAAHRLIFALEAQAE
ncbi:MAG: amidohydrolase family protein, partial [Chloroflexi bacterium]|nr:amidohydrolase family protein [Chloroflexota bacterium]